jgi:hypothetical protein
LRVLHLTDWLSDRGGAHRHLLGVVEALRDAGHAVFLAAAVAGELAPDPVHVHTVVNPNVLEWAAHGLDRRADADGPPCVLFVGRLTEAKGAREAVQAWRLSGVVLPLVMAGTGPLRAEMEASGAEVLGIAVWRR